MQFLTEKVAKDKVCPHFSAIAGESIKCAPNDCMAWEETERLVEREDHSGADEMMAATAQRRRMDSPDVEVERRGGPGSSGILFIRARGICRKLFPKLK